MKIYLAGSIPKGAEEAKEFENWRVAYTDILQMASPQIETIDPDEHTMHEGDQFLVFGCDCADIACADLVVVNAEMRMGVGTSQEMCVAKYYEKPVIVVLPRDTYHRRSHVRFRKWSEPVADWIHPFLFGFSDVIVASREHLPEALKAIKTRPTKTMAIVEAAAQFAKTGGSTAPRDAAPVLIG